MNWTKYADHKLRDLVTVAAACTSGAEAPIKSLKEICRKRGQSHLSSCPDLTATATQWCASRSNTTKRLGGRNHYGDVCSECHHNHHAFPPPTTGLEGAGRVSPSRAYSRVRLPPGHTHTHTHTLLFWLPTELLQVITFVRLRIRNPSPSN